MEEFFRLKATENKSIAATMSNIERSKNSELLISTKPEIKKVNTRIEVAKSSGIGSDTIYKIKDIKENTPSEVLSDLEKKLITGEISINQAHKFVRMINSINQIYP